MSIKWNVETHPALESTQRFLKVIEKDKDEGFAVQALEQTKGKGRHGREWVSPQGNLYISFLLKPHCSLAQAGQVSFVAALAVYDAVRDAVGAGADIILKWPNDVLLNGRKCAGILLDSDTDAPGTVSSLIVGMGVNLISAPSEIGISLRNAGGNTELQDFRDEMLDHFAARYSLWQAQGFDGTRAQWLEHAHRPGTAMNIKVGRDTIEGLFENIDDQGNLLLRDSGGTLRTVSAGEVHFQGKD